MEKVEEDLKNYELTAVYENIENAFEFRYIPTLNGYELVKYTGNARVVEIPALYKDLPVKIINGSSFNGNKSICNVILPDTITKIGGGAFSGCTSLVSIKIPNSVTDIGDWTFNGCTSLADITLSNSLTEIGSQAFDDCTSLKSVAIPNSVTTIGSYAFENCTSLTSITIPNSVTSIDGGAFRDCISLKSVVIPNSVMYIISSAFKNCKNLKTIYVESEKIVNSTYVEHCLFDYADDIYIPADIEITNSYFDVVCEKKENVIINNKEYYHFKRR